MRRRLAAPLFVLALSGCAHGALVERAYGGHLVVGTAVAPQAYAAFLRGAMAEADGDAKAALAAYEEASREDPRSPEIWTRIAEVSCAADPHDARADAAFTRASSEGPGLARVVAAQARCLLARGDVAGARAAAGRAAELDPTADGANVLWATTAAPPADAQVRAVLIGLTLTARDPVVAWSALARWAQSHGDVQTWARALSELARVAPSRRDDVARASEELAGSGHASEAMAVAAAAADADERPLRADHVLAARLAVDAAIERPDLAKMRRRATRVRMSLDEAAARALLGGERTLARTLASEVAKADAGAAGARLVLAALGGDPGAAPLDVQGAVEVPAPAAAFVAFGLALLHASTPARTGAALRRIAHQPIVPGDDRVLRPAVELAARGALAPEELPPDGVVELAARRGEALPEALVGADAPRQLDARHEYLALALVHPESPRARSLAARLDGGDPPDAVVAAASALMRLGSGGAQAAAAARALLARDAGDPLLVATALRVAEKAGDRDVARRAREVLTALGAGERRGVE